VKTLEEIQELKIAWRNDPVWDIEDTEGFEDYYDELLAYRKKVQQKRKDQQEKELILKADKIGVPGNVTLAKYIDYMEWRIKQLEEVVREINNPD
jgi:MFS superfamily sulfate permease-like transporter